MFDESHDTCWNSDQGSPQWILLDFTEVVSFTSIAFTFQGGFVGQEANIEIGETSTATMEPVLTIYSILDNNNLQKFSLIPNSDTSSRKGRYLKITFPSSTDFYGRVTIYSLQVYGIREI